MTETDPTTHRSTSDGVSASVAEPDRLFAPSDPRPVAIGALRTDLSAAPEAYAPIFARHRAIECPDLVATDFLAGLIDRCRRGGFVAEDVEWLGSREIETPERVGIALSIALGRPSFLRWIEAVTGHRGLERVSGRVVQARANAIDALDWHDDRYDKARRLAIVVNLSDAGFDGGGFELREVATGRMLTTYRHQRAGTALIFDVADDIEHRVLPVTGGGPRRVFTGWFMASDRA